MTSKPVRQLTHKVLTTSYEPDRIHSAAVRHMLQCIQDDPEIQGELEARGMRFQSPESCPDVFVNGNRQGIYILLREVIQDAARDALPGSELRIGMALSETGLGISLSYVNQRVDSMRLQSQVSPALHKIMADMHSALRHRRESDSGKSVTEVELALA